MSEVPRYPKAIYISEEHLYLDAGICVEQSKTKCCVAVCSYSDVIAKENEIQILKAEIKHLKERENDRSKFIHQ